MITNLLHEIANGGLSRNQATYEKHGKQCSYTQNLLQTAMNSLIYTKA